MLLKVTPLKVLKEFSWYAPSPQPTDEITSLVSEKVFTRGNIYIYIYANGKGE